MSFYTGDGIENVSDAPDSKPGKHYHHETDEYEHTETDACSQDRRTEEGANRCTEQR